VATATPGLRMTDAISAPLPQELRAPADWQTVDLIADLHLQESEPETLQAWLNYLHRTPAQAVFMLGDLFEVWVGDDAALEEADSFEGRCGQAMRAVSQQRALFFMAGNRDFLLGARYAEASGLQLLADPTVLVLGQERILLSHGDALCLDDVRYMQFRAMVRNPAWQQGMLAKPLAERKALARQMREQSQANQRRVETYVDLHAQATQAWMDAAQSRLMIHGHTHQPADHQLADGRQRIVLSDWDARAQPPRLEVLRLTRAGDGALTRQRLPL
jgi:UDP-2,3-diacylglucosamine hydrolase